MLYAYFLAAGGMIEDAKKHLPLCLRNKAAFGTSECCNCALLYNLLDRPDEVAEMLALYEKAAGHLQDWTHFYLPTSPDPDPDFIAMTKRPGFDEALKRERARLHLIQN